MEQVEHIVEYERVCDSGHAEAILVAVSPEVHECLLAFQRKLSAQQRQGRRHGSMYDLETVSAFIPSAACVEEEVIRSSRTKLVRKAVCSLPQTQRRRIVMRYYQGLTVREIAEKEGVRANNIDKTLGLAFEKLKKILCNLEGG